MAYSYEELQKIITTGVAQFLFAVMTLSLKAQDGNARKKIDIDRTIGEVPVQKWNLLSRLIPIP